MVLVLYQSYENETVEFEEAKMEGNFRRRKSKPSDLLKKIRGKKPSSFAIKNLIGVCYLSFSIDCKWFRFVDFDVFVHCVQNLRELWLKISAMEDLL